ncbi:MAG: nitroreductase [Dehalococcoidia bacterium]|nr:nitroreductase [Dehalococcoidia bacterium]
MAEERSEPRGTAPNKSAPLATLSIEPRTKPLRHSSLRLFLSIFVPFHILVYRLTRGRLLGGYGLPFLLLTATGRKSGKRRTIPLLYFEDDGLLLVVASMGGAPKSPGWYHNLVANPEVQVETRDGKWAMWAEPLVGEERHHHFQRIKAAAKRFAEYETRTEREIPVVALRKIA